MSTLARHVVLGSRGLCAARGDGAEVMGGEAQMLADERARDRALPGLAAQPRFLDRQQRRRLGRGVQDDVVLRCGCAACGRFFALLPGGS